MDPISPTKLSSRRGPSNRKVHSPHVEEKTTLKPTKIESNFRSRKFEINKKSDNSRSTPSSIDNIGTPRKPVFHKKDPARRIPAEETDPKPSTTESAPFRKVSFRPRSNTQQLPNQPENGFLDKNGPSVFATSNADDSRSRTGRKIQTTFNQRELRTGIPASKRFASRSDGTEVLENSKIVNSRIVNSKNVNSREVNSKIEESRKVDTRNAPKKIESTSKKHLDFSKRDSLAAGSENIKVDVPAILEVTRRSAPSTVPTIVEDDSRRNPGRQRGRTSFAESVDGRNNARRGSSKSDHSRVEEVNRRNGNRFSKDEVDTIRMRNSEMKSRIDGDPRSRGRRPDQSGTQDARSSNSHDGRLSNSQEGRPNFPDGRASNFQEGRSNSPEGRSSNFQEGRSNSPDGRSSSPPDARSSNQEGRSTTTFERRNGVEKVSRGDSRSRIETNAQEVDSRKRSRTRSRESTKPDVTAPEVVTILPEVSTSNVKEIDPVASFQTGTASTVTRSATTVAPRIVSTTTSRATRRESEGTTRARERSGTSRRKASKEDFYNHGLGFRGRRPLPDGTQGSTIGTITTESPQRGTTTSQESQGRGNPGWSLHRRPYTGAESSQVMMEEELTTTSGSVSKPPGRRGNKTFVKTPGDSVAPANHENIDGENYPPDFKAKLAQLVSFFYFHIVLLIKYCGFNFIYFVFLL